MSLQNSNFRIKRIHRMENSRAIKAFVDLVVDDAILIKGLRVVNGPRGLFVTMPQEKGKNNQWYNTVDCLSNDIKSSIVDCVLTAYKDNGDKLNINA